jgi:flagellar biosynthesis component FlhA
MKYRNFYLIARLMGALAWILGILIFVYFLVSGITAEPVEGASALAVPLMIVMGVVSGFLTFIFFYAFSQFIYVIIDIERNTRQTLRAILEESEMEEDETEEREVEEGEIEEGETEESE